MSFSFMMLTSRLDCRVTALSMICSGLQFCIPFILHLLQYIESQTITVHIGGVRLLQQYTHITLLKDLHIYWMHKYEQMKS